MKVKQLNLKYIKDNYLTLDDLAREAGVDAETVQGLINEKFIPGASYTVKENTEISSPLGDAVVYTSTTEYFPKSTVKLISAQATKEKTTVKQSFKTVFRRLLESHPDKTYAYGNICGNDGMLLEAEFEKAFDEEWQAYVDGVYGICTNNATAAEIVNKEIAVKKLIEFNSKYENKTLTEQEKEKLKRLQEEFDSVANLFAPYQRETSSRGKYLDKILEANGMSDLVKQY